MKRKKVLGMLLLSVSLMTAAISGCSKEESNITQNRQNGQESQTDSNTTEEDNAKAEEVEIEALKEITDWETNANISLGDKISIDGTGATESENVITITKGGEYVFTGTLENGKIVVNAEDDVKITLDNVNLTSENAAAIYGENSNSIYISTTKGSKNTISDSGEYEDAKGSIFSNDTLVLSGEGSLTVTGNYKHAVCSDDMIYMESGTITIESAVKDGFHANDGICIDGGKIQILSCEEGLESENSCVIHSGKIEITAKNDGINTGNELKICGGSIFADVENGDGLDSNGALEISGGVTVAMGGDMPEGGIDCDQREIVVTGGTLIACGGTNSSISESESTVVSVLLGSANAGDKIGIIDKDGNTVFAFETEKKYANMVLSSTGFENNEEYTVYIGGSIDGESNYHGYYKNAVYSNGEESISFTADSKVISAGGTSDAGMGGGGQMPQNGEIPQDGTMPERKEMPQGGDMSEGKQPPQNGKMPNDLHENDRKESQTEASNTDSL